MEVITDSVGMKIDSLLETKRTVSDKLVRIKQEQADAEFDIRNIESELATIAAGLIPSKAAESKVKRAYAPRATNVPWAPAMEELLANTFPGRQYESKFVLGILTGRGIPQTSAPNFHSNAVFTANFTKTGRGFYTRK